MNGPIYGDFAKNMRLATALGKSISRYVNNMYIYGDPNLSLYFNGF